MQISDALTRTKSMLSVGDPVIEYAMLLRDASVLVIQDVNVKRDF